MSEYHDKRAVEIIKQIRYATLATVTPEGLPWNSPVAYEYDNDTTLKVTDTDSFYSEGELVRFNFKDGKVELVVHNGTTMWPAEVWFEKQQARKQVK